MVTGRHSSVFSGQGALGMDEGGRVDAGLGRADRETEWGCGISIKEGTNGFQGKGAALEDVAPGGFPSS